MYCGVQQKIRHNGREKGDERKIVLHLPSPCSPRRGNMKNIYIHPTFSQPNETQLPSLEEERPDALEMAAQAHQAGKAQACAAARIILTFPVILPVLSTLLKPCLSSSCSFYPKLSQIRKLFKQAVFPSPCTKHSRLQSSIFGGIKCLDT